MTFGHDGFVILNPLLIVMALFVSIPNDDDSLCFQFLVMMVLYHFEPPLSHNGFLSL
jgi:hypothetical protein